LQSMIPGCQSKSKLKKLLWLFGLPGPFMIKNEAKGPG